MVNFYPDVLSQHRHPNQHHQHQHQHHHRFSPSLFSVGLAKGSYRGRIYDDVTATLYPSFGRMATLQCFSAPTSNDCFSPDSSLFSARLNELVSLITY
jgi:hypothetical protein